MNEKLSEMAKVAFQRRIESQLATDFAIQWPGSRFDTSDHTEWIQPHWMGFDSIPANGTTKVRDHLAQINCFARMGEEVGSSNEVSTNRIHEIVDKVSAAFRHEELSVKDIDQAGEPEVATMTFKTPDTDRVPPANAPGGEGDQVAVTFSAILENF